MSGPAKVTRRFQRLIVKRSIEGYSPNQILEELYTKGVIVSKDTVWLYQRRFRDEIAEGLEEQWMDAVATVPEAKLEHRLRKVQEWIEAEESKENPSMATLGQLMHTIQSDVHRHEANLIRFKALVMNAKDDEDDRQAREIAEMKEKHERFIRTLEAADTRRQYLEAPDHGDSSEV